MFRVMRLLVLATSFASAIFSAGRAAVIATCVGSFGLIGIPPAPCTLQASSAGPLITNSGTVNTSGDTVNYSASSVSVAGSLGGVSTVNSNTFNSSGPGVMVDALEQLLDTVTVSNPLLNGSAGRLVLYYTLHGTNSTTGNNISFACVKIGINAPIFPFGCVAYHQPSVSGSFASAVFPFTYGVPFPLWFQLESIAGPGFGAGRPTGIGSSSANFGNTATIAGVVLYDQNMNPVNVTPTFTSALGIPYQFGFPVAIEIKPGDDTVSINPRSRGKIPVAILSTPTFDALTVDAKSLTFGRTGSEHSLSLCNQGGEDVNGDGLQDLVCHFDAQQADFQPGDIAAGLKGSTVSGVPIQGQEAISIVP